MHCERQYRPAVGSPAAHLYLIPFVCYKVGPPNTDRRYFQCALCCKSLPSTGVTDHHPPLWLLPINEEDICGALGPHQVGYVYQLMGGRGGEGRGVGGEGSERGGEKRGGRRAGGEKKGAGRVRGVEERRGKKRGGRGRGDGGEGKAVCTV